MVTVLTAHRRLTVEDAMSSNVPDEMVKAADAAAKDAEKGKESEREALEQRGSASGPDELPMTAEAKATDALADARAECTS